MNKSRTLSQKLSWIFFVARRFARVDRNGRAAVTSFLATLGICFGVMTLIVVVSVMNGFQMGFKDAIMEITSYHIRVTDIAKNDSQPFMAWCASQRDIVSVTPFTEAQSLVAGKHGMQSAALIRAVPKDICMIDPGFRRETAVVAGSFTLNTPGSIVLGSLLADSLGVSVGGTVNLLALSGSQDVQLLSQTRVFTVTGIFRSGYADINSTYAFISTEDGEIYFGNGAEKTYGIKLKRSGLASPVLSSVMRAFPAAHGESWQTYNRSFFGVLRVEKNMLMLIVFLIFFVVGINIYNGMNRLVFERRPDISVLSALGAPGGEIKMLFVARGFLTGLTGSFAGLILGIFMSVNMSAVFRFVSGVMYYARYFTVMVTDPAQSSFISENPMYQLYASIPARLFPGEVCMITLFGIAAPLIASYAASRKVLLMTTAEVLHDE